MKGTVAVAALFAAGLLGGTAVLAGEDRPAEGLICELSAERIVVMVKEAKVAAAITPSTQYRKGKALASREDLKIGQRIIVTIGDEEGRPVAREVRIWVPRKPRPKS